MGTKRIGRRSFLARTSLGIAAAATRSSSLAQMGGGGMGGGGGGMGGGGGVIDPPVGPKLADPVVSPNRSATPGIVEVDIDARVATVMAPGTRPRSRR